MKGCSALIAMKQSGASILEAQSRIIIGSRGLTFESQLEGKIDYEKRAPGEARRLRVLFKARGFYII
ncbi:MAG: hypothetical protein AUG51_17095 [Acidobacteria bacterium 13_1_20CM_3_53_8]|nr:MAG: hypothetical protein AUG51_17095 [Acidobacteria bacterium 13_1_20CM_3_53_8]